MGGEKTLQVTATDDGQRVDVFLALYCTEMTRSQIKAAAENGMVSVNGTAVRASRKVKVGEVVLLNTPAPKPSAVLAEAIPLEIVYEDESLVVVNKPAGMVIHPACGHYTGTLVNAILYHCPDLSGIGGVLRPGIVHRLDKDTSGLVVIAKSDGIHQNLCMQFKQRLVEKRYFALVFGDVKEKVGEVSLPIGRHPRERKLMSAGGKRAKEALTRWSLRESFSVATLLEVTIKTGRTHQIRVHMNAVAHPVIGDAVYGRGKMFNAVSDTIIRARLKSFPRQALHAAHLAFQHPLDARQMTFSSPLPADMEELITFLRDSLTS